MKRTHQFKKLFGLDNGPVGVHSDDEHDVHDCTVCDTRFDAGDPQCPSCGGRIFRTKTIVPNAALNLLLVFAVSGLGVVYNLLTGDLPKESPKEQ